MTEKDPITSDMQRFARLWAVHQRAVASYIRVFVQNHANAEDVLQDVAYSAAGSFERYDSSRPFAGWAIAIAKQRIADHYRRHGRQQLLLSEAAMDSLAIASTDAANDPEADDRLDALQNCLAKLTPRQRQAVDYRYGRAYSASQVAEEIGSNTVAVNALIYRVRKLLLDCIQDRMGGLSS